MKKKGRIKKDEWIKSEIFQQIQRSEKKMNEIDDFLGRKL